MIYAKAKIGEHAEVRIALDYDNVFTVCPQCGKEHSIDISEFFQDGDFDFDCSVYCEDCSKKNLKQMEESAWMN